MARSRRVARAVSSLAEVKSVVKEFDQWFTEDIDVIHTSGNGRVSELVIEYVLPDEGCAYITMRARDDA